MGEVEESEYIKNHILHVSIDYNSFCPLLLIVFCLQSMIWYLVIAVFHTYLSLISKPNSLMLLFDSWVFFVM